MCRSTVGTGTKAWESGTDGYLGAFLGAGYAQDRGLGFSLEAVPSWDAGALFRKDQGPAGTRENKSKQETRYWVWCESPSHQ